MEYESTVWSPYYAKNIAKPESVQRRMACFIFNNDYRPQCSVTSLLETLQWPALYKRRECNRLLMFFKIIHNHVDIPMQSSIFMPNISNTRGNTFRFIQLQPRIDCYAKSFIPKSVKLWNSLPDSIVKSKLLRKTLLIITIIVYIVYNDQCVIT